MCLSAPACNEALNGAEEAAEGNPGGVRLERSARYPVEM